MNQLNFEKGVADEGGIVRPKGKEMHARNMAKSR